MPSGIALTIREYGANTDGTAVLVLHGGGGPRTVTGFSAQISAHSYVIAPVHPGFDGTARPEQTDSMADLATAYLDLLDVLDLNAVMVIGNSIGGWIASEMALRDNHGRLGSLVLLNAVGIHTPTKQNHILDVRTIDPAELGKLSFADVRRRPDFSALAEEERAASATNPKTLAVYGGEHFSFDPKLRARLHRVSLPVLVVWGEHDGIARLEYGREYAEAFGDAQFVTIADAGHLPQIEQPEAVIAAIFGFVRTVAEAA